MALRDPVTVLVQLLSGGRVRRAVRDTERLVPQGEQGYCPLCAERCTQGKQFAQHLARAHAHKPPWTFFAGPNSQCPACLIQYSSRIRLVAHLAGKTSSGNACFSHLVLSKSVPYTLVEVSRFEEEQNEEAKALKARGRSGNTATKAWHRVPGPKLPLLTGTLPAAAMQPELLPLARRQAA